MGKDLRHGEEEVTRRTKEIHKSRVGIRNLGKLTGMSKKELVMSSWCTRQGNKCCLQMHWERDNQVGKNSRDRLACW